MNYFLNMQNGKVSIGTSALLDEFTTVDDVVFSFQAKHGGCLTAELNSWIEEQAEKIKYIAESCATQEELDDFVMGEGDFLEYFLKREFGIHLADYPDLRDIQQSQFDYIEFV